MSSKFESCIDPRFLSVYLNTYCLYYNWYEIDMENTIRGLQGPASMAGQTWFNLIIINICLS